MIHTCFTGLTGFPRVGNSHNTPALSQFERWGNCRLHRTLRFRHWSHADGAGGSSVSCDLDLPLGLSICCWVITLSKLTNLEWHSNAEETKISKETYIHPWITWKVHNPIVIFIFWVDTSSQPVSLASQYGYFANPCNGPSIICLESSENSEELTR